MGQPKPVVQSSLKRTYPEEGNRISKAQKLSTIPETADADDEFDVSFSGIFRSSTVADGKSAPGSSNNFLDDSFDKIVIDSNPSSLNNSVVDLLDVSDSKNQPSKKDPIVEPLVFQNIIRKRGRPKLSREGRKTPKKTKNSRFIDEVESIFPKKSSDLENEAIGRKHVRGPYKKNKNKDSDTSGSAYSNQSYGDLKPHLECLARDQYTSEDPTRLKTRAKWNTVLVISYTRRNQERNQF